MNGKTCGQCAHFRLFFGEQQGECFALPPRVLNLKGELLPVPKIKSNRHSCGLFVLATAVEVKSKVDLETVGDALKLKRTEAALAKS